MRARGDGGGGDERCVTMGDLEPSCPMRCDWPTDCAYRFDGFDGRRLRSKPERSSGPMY